MKDAKGFTLIELMIVVVVVSILASIAIPAYDQYIIRGKLVDATGQLADARIKMEQFYQDYKVYDTSTGGAPPCDSIAASKYFTYSCTYTPTTYVITAASLAGQGVGATGDYTYTINESNTKITVMFAGVAMNQVAPQQCWLMKKGDSC
jgi:type IV pilus assembly protein PilE